MIWKLLGLQKKLDALFDDGWIILGIAPLRDLTTDALDAARAQS